MPSDKSKPYKSIRIRQLRAFSACLRAKSFSAAARMLDLSQPVVWEQVRALERSLGVDLLTRSGRDLLPTDDGELLLELATSVIAGMDSLESQFAERRKHAVRRLTVAAATSIIVEDLAEVISEFVRARPQVRLSIEAEQNNHVVELVATGAADLGIVQFGRLDSISPYVVPEELYERNWSLFTQRKHLLLAKRDVALSDLVAYPLILEARQFIWRQMVDEQFRRAGLIDRMNVVLEVNNALAARRFVSLGLGITILPRPAHTVALPNLGSRSLEGVFPNELVTLIWRKGATPKPAARDFAELARTMLNKSVNAAKTASPRPTPSGKS